MMTQFLHLVSSESNQIIFLKKQQELESFTMSVAALFRGKWGHKSQETQVKQAPAVIPPSHEEEEDDEDPQGGFTREPIRRNSRFYRSMRKKRHVLSEQSESKTTLGPCHIFEKLSNSLFALVHIKVLSIFTSTSTVVCVTKPLSVYCFSVLYGCPDDSSCRRTKAW